MIIKNPTKEAIEVSIGTMGNAGAAIYRIEAEGTLENVPEEHARYWQESLHKFLILKKEKETVKETIEIPEEVIFSREEIAEQGVDVEAVEAEAEILEDVEAVIVPTKEKKPAKAKK